MRTLMFDQWTGGSVLVLLLAGIIVARADEGTDSSGGAPRLELSIAVPLIDDTRPIFVTGPAAHFHVVLRNRSAEPIRIWREGNSWGHAALRFQVADADGRAIEVRRRPVPFLQNAPTFETLSPGDAKVFDIYFAGDQWEAFPLPDDGASLELKLQAIYEVADDDAARTHHVWVGKISSKAEVCRFQDRR